MGAMQRTKGQSGERELLKLLGEHLGCEFKRKVRQHKDDPDAVILGLWAVEIKRRASRPDIAAWWAQACRQAEAVKKLPLLAYRLDRQPWRFVVAMQHLAVEYSGQPIGMYATLGLEEAVLVIREAL